MKTQMSSPALTLLKPAVLKWRKPDPKKGAWKGMQFMTFNLRFENNIDGDNSWNQRRDIVVEVVKKYSPSVLGTQEGTPRQIEYMREHLPEYEAHIPDRPVDETCQYPTLFCRSDEVLVQEGGEFWLSCTPDIHRSKDWDSAFPRMMSYALCRYRPTGKPFWVIATHLDHMSSQARLQQARIILEWVKERTAPVALMGDFNDHPGSPPHRLLTSAEDSLLDSWQALGREENENSMTHHGFLGTPRKHRLDWILLSPRFRVLDARIIRDHNNGRYPSDHFPYMVECEYI
jgi:endonuclease/exonuclease/phosphatase family metal-dependent hydrolase